MWSDGKKKQFEQNVCSVQLMQGWLVLYVRPQRGGGRRGRESTGRCIVVVRHMCVVIHFESFVCRHILKLKKMQGPESPFVYMCGLMKKRNSSNKLCVVCN